MNESGAFFNRNTCFTMDLATLGLGWSVAVLCATLDYGDSLASFRPFSEYHVSGVTSY